MEYWPDGSSTQTINDGQVWSYLCPTTGNTEFWQYDMVLMKWEKKAGNVSSYPDKSLIDFKYNVLVTNTGSPLRALYNPPNVAWDEASFGIDLAQSPQIKCECGKEKHGFASHSTWCDMYEDLR